MEMLRSGSQGETVLALQKRLQAKGINPGPIDGIFGSKTEDAVRRYQEQKGLQVDGIAGPQTFTALGMMEPETPEATEAAKKSDQPDRDDRHKARIRTTERPGEVEAKKKPPTAPSGIEAMRDVEKKSKKKAEKRADSGAQAMQDTAKAVEKRADSGAQAMQDTAKAAEKKAPKGFKAKIAAMKEARRTRGR